MHMNSSSTVKAARRGVLYSRDDICVSMELLPESEEYRYRYRLDCGACGRFCDFSFRSRDRLSFANAAKLAGAFSLPCRRLGVKEEATGERIGQLPLISSVDSEV